MRKRLIGATILVAGAVAAGQLAGATAAQAATHKNKTKTGLKTKATTGTSLKQRAAGTSATPHADGTVTAVSADGNTITVKPDSDPAGSTEYTGVTTIILNGSTKYEAGKGTTTTTRPTIAVGQNIVAEGTVSSDGKTLTATLVSTHAGGKGHGGAHSNTPHADGTVTAVSADGNTISVKADTDPAGSNEYTAVTTIILTGSTQYEAGKGSTSPTKPTIAVGQYIVAEGTLSNNNTTLTATTVSVGSKGPGGH